MGGDTSPPTQFSSARGPRTSHFFLCNKSCQIPVLKISIPLESKALPYHIFPLQSKAKGHNFVRQGGGEREDRREGGSEGGRGDP